MKQKRSARWKHNQVYFDLLLCQIKKLLKPGKIRIQKIGGGNKNGHREMKVLKTRKKKKEKTRIMNKAAKTNFKEG